MLKFLDAYVIFARYLPAILSALPIFVFWFYLSNNVQLEMFISFILSLKFLRRNNDFYSSPVYL